MKAAEPEELSRGPTLVVSAEGTRLGVGLLVGGAWEAVAEDQGTAVERLPGLAREVVSHTGNAPRHWVYSGGPGTLLGLRFTSLFLQSWARTLRGSPRGHPPLAHRFSGMVWTAREIWRAEQQPFSLWHRWRRGAWNRLAVEGGELTEADLAVTEGAPEAFLGTRPCRELLLRADAQPSVPGATTVALPPFPTLCHHLGAPGFLTPTLGFPPLQGGSSAYRKWTGRVHGSAPAP